MNKKNRIVLIGYRGCGKSTIAKLLANKLGWALFSTDFLIEKQTGMSIPEIVKLHGWDYFRDIETQICQKLTERNIIIDAGGGIILREKNMIALKQENTLIVLLEANINDIAVRISNTDRPSLTENDPVTEIEDVLNKRKTLYRKYADFIINTSRYSAKDASLQILKKLNFKDKDS